VTVRDLVEAYARSRDPQYFAPDAIVEQMPLGRVLRGRAAIGAMLRTFYLDTLVDPVEHIARVAVDEFSGIGLVESTLQGRHAHEPLGIALGGTAVELPMVAVYEIQNGLLARGRIYFDVATLLGELRRGALARR
jgi:limonene-1,2-epoxide hydrolase